MPRYALRIEYDGNPFSGWQRQAGQPSVQKRIEDALSAIERVAPKITGAGRTDAGVHALAQVAHCDLTKEWNPFRLCEALNFHLKPDPVAILAASPVSNDFHARFSAVERRYLYRVISRRAPLTHERGLAWRVGNKLDIAAMRAGAGYLLGHHDFTTFRSTECQAKSPEKTLDVLDITQHPVAQGMEYRFHLRARSFLHNQVRSFVGTLERVGAGAWPPERVREALEARDRSACGPVAPPLGLYLSGVEYPENPFPTE